MRSLTLLRLTLLVVVSAGAFAVGAWFFTSYWGDLRTTVAYGLVREASLASDEEGALTVALDVDADNWLAHLRLGEMRLFDDDVDGAEEHLRAALAANPVSPRANYAMGVVQYRRGSPEAALPYFEAAAELDPGNRQYEGMILQLRSLTYGVDDGSSPAVPSESGTP